MKMSKEITFVGGNVLVTNPEKPHYRYLVEYIIFDPKKKVPTAEEAKNVVRIRRRVSKAVMKENFDIIYAASKINSRKGKEVLSFTTCKKAEADTIFVIPKKYKKVCKSVINDLKQPW